MAIIPNQKFRFLGGEVSPNLYHSADMDQYGRWFSKAENIRFDTLGAFRNRTGFDKVALSKVNNGEAIKLLSFNFSKEESYLIEMGPGYFRFFQDGQPIYNNGNPNNGIYEVYHTISIISGDVKYAQSGDVLYLVNGVDPIATLTRNDTTGYNWTFEYFKFKDDCYPLKEENDDKYKTLSITGGAFIGKAWAINFYSASDLFVAKNVTVTIVGSTTKTYTTPPNTFYNGAGLATYLNSLSIGTDFSLSCKYEDGTRRLIFQDTGTSTSATSITLTATYTATDYVANMGLVREHVFSATLPTNTYLYKLYLNDKRYQNRTFSLAAGADSWVNSYSFAAQISGLNALFAAQIYQGSITSADNNQTITAFLGGNEYKGLGLFSNLANMTFNVYGGILQTKTFSAIQTSTVNTNAVTVNSSGHNFFEDKNVGDTFAIEYDVGPESINWNGGTSAVGTITNTITTNGTFTAATSGGWGGAFVIEYSADKTNWTIIKTVESSNIDSPHNINEVINVKDDSDLIYVRARVIVQLSQAKGKNSDNQDIYFPLNLYVAGTKFSVNSYYKILQRNSNTQAICGIVKNEWTPATGVTWSNQTRWKEAAFSSEEKYPSVIGFYQNRMFLGKEYYLYGSKVNDFSDFYLDPELTAEDPITMSLLSYRYNRIRNILTVRKFFVFSEEGEFGISSTGALTQTDKNLLPLSYHGSSDCLPILAGNLALFVDQTGNCVRLFQYSYETDMFEANDASVFLEQLLKGRTIVTTDYLKKSKEALFLDNSGTIWVFKLMPEQEVYAWSHIKYATSGKITNIRVVANGAEEDLYVAVEDTNLGEKRIEKLSTDKFYDSSKTYTSELRTNRFYTGLAKGTELVVDYDIDKSTKIITQDNGLIVIPEHVYSITCHYIYTSVATLLSPTTNLTEGVYTTYNKGKPFKVYFAYQNSYGFKVGVEEEEKMIVRLGDGDFAPETGKPTSGKRNVLIPARYDGSSRVTFIQERPYNMAINNIMIDMDYGGK